jgi:hypothetical protein
MLRRFFFILFSLADAWLDANTVLRGELPEVSKDICLHFYVPIITKSVNVAFAGFLS